MQPSMLPTTAINTKSTASWMYPTSSSRRLGNNLEGKLTLLGFSAKNSFPDFKNIF